MTLDVFFTPAAAEGAELGGRTVIVVDVLRATSSMVHALAHGARGIVPAATIDDAVERRRALGDADGLLCGERDGRRIEGFDLGNSPSAFRADRVAGRTLVMTTTNGTRALLTVTDAARVLVGSLQNLDAAADAAAGAGGGAPAIVCAGRRGRLALEDALCAGLLVERLRERPGTRPDLNDAGRLAVRLARDVGGSPGAVLRDSAAGRKLAAIGRGDDIDFCAVVNRHDLVPRLLDRQVRLP